MNDSFRRLCDLVADAEDLLARVEDSDDPRLRTLSSTVSGSVERMKRELRHRRWLVRQERRARVRLAGATVLVLACAATSTAWWVLRRTGGFR